MMPSALPIIPGQTLNNKFVVDRPVYTNPLYIIYNGFELDTRMPVQIRVRRLFQNCNAFEESAHIAKQLRHPYIVAPLEFGLISNEFGYTIEKTHGLETLDYRASLDPYSLPQLSQFVPQISLALNFLHTQALSHCSISPLHIVFESQAAKLCGFGLVTPGDPIALFPRFAAPELFIYQVHPSADIYSLSLSIWFAIKGAPALPTDSYLKCRKAHLSKRKWKPQKHLDLPSNFASMLERGLQKQPDRRPFNILIYSEMLMSFTENSLPTSPKIATDKILEESRKVQKMGHRRDSSRSPNTITIERDTTHSITQHSHHTFLNSQSESSADIQKHFVQFPSKTKSRIQYPVQVVGDIFNNRYELLEEVGDGGFSQVFKARTIATNKIVALKLHVPTLGNAESSELRFEQEAKIYALLSSPSTVRLIDHGRAPSGQPFIVFEFISGINLNIFIKQRNSLSFQDTSFITSQILASIAEAHSKGLIHRDLKPQNVMIITDPDSPNLLSIKVIDFGIAKFVDSYMSSTLEITMDGTAVGTPRYMSPEQLLGEQIGPETDIYSIGIMTYYMLSGEHPYTGNNYAAIQAQLSPESILLPEHLNIPTDLRNTINQMMIKDRDQRPSSARMLKLMFEQFIQYPSV